MCLFSEAEKANCVSEDLYKTWVSLPNVQLDVGINYNDVKRAFVLFFAAIVNVHVHCFRKKKNLTLAKLEERHFKRTHSGWYILLTCT